MRAFVCVSVCVRFCLQSMMIVDRPCNPTQVAYPYSNAILLFEGTDRCASKQHGHKALPPGTCQFTAQPKARGRSRGQFEAGIGAPRTHARTYARNSRIVAHTTQSWIVSQPHLGGMAQPRRFTTGDFLVGDTLGEGSFARVRVCTQRGGWLAGAGTPLHPALRAVGVFDPVGEAVHPPPPPFIATCPCPEAASLLRLQPAACAPIPNAYLHILPRCCHVL
jgi:hypothetical protein